VLLKGMTTMRCYRAAAVLAVPLLAVPLGGPGSAQAATAGCRGWTGLQPPSPGSNTVLNGVTVLSACDAWAAGSFDTAAGVQETLIEHWDGANWTVVPSPDPGSSENFLEGVRAASATSIWAVGSYNNGGSSLGKTLILHWDGKHWTQQTTPSTGTGSDVLAAVRTVSGSEAWAVGTSSGDTLERPIALHFTGGRWHQVQVPAVLANEELNGVAATSAKDVWAVGTTFGAASKPTPLQSLILHWDGKKWTHVPSPAPAAGSGHKLFAVGAATPSSAMAVGTEILPNADERTLALRWNGTAWARVTTTNPGGTRPDDFLEGVTITSPGSAWAVGQVNDGTGGHALIERWNDSAWSTVQAPDPGSTSGLNGIAASSGTQAWAVGFASGSGGDQAYAAHCC
jgi:hypothetical protein